MKTSQLIVITLLSATSTLLAQRPSGVGAPRGFGSEELAKLFGRNDAFSAVAEVTVQEKKESAPMQMEMQYAFLKGNLRTEMDQSTMKGGNIPPQAAAQMKQMGMDKMVNIFHSDTRTMYMVYPGLKAYCEIKTPQRESSTNAPPKFEVTPLGKETVDGHPCEKNKITIINEDGTTHTVIAWQATDLNKFPVKSEMDEHGNTITTHFRDIKLSAPDASLFQPPADFTKYDSMQAMMMGSMQRMMGGH